MSSYFQYYTRRSHTNYISQKYNRETIEYFLDSFSSSANVRSSTGFPLTIEIRHKAALCEENNDRLMNDDVSRIHSIAPQLDNKATASEDYSVINDHICQTKDGDIISCTKHLSDKAALTETVGNNAHESLEKDENIKPERKVSPIYQVEDDDNMSFDRERISKVEPIYQVEDEDNISYDNEQMNKFDSIDHIKNNTHKCMNEIALTISTKSSSDDGDVNYQMTEFSDDNEQSGSGLNATSEELDGQLSIDASAVDLNFQQSETWLDDQSYSRNSESQIDLKSSKDRYLKHQSPASLTQLFTAMTNNTHLMDLKVCERQPEKRDKMPPYLEITRCEI